MPLSLLDMKKVDEYISFYNGIHPDIKDAKKRFLWQFAANPFLKGDYPYVLLSYKDGKIVGQSLLSPFEWHFRGKTRRDYLGNDWYMMEGYRGAMGSALAMQTLKDRPYYFGIGFSEMAERVWKYLGVRKIGNAKKFMWLRNPLRLRKILRHSGSADMKPLKIPKRVAYKGMTFLLAERPMGWKESYWKDTLQFSHTAEFVRWRFFDSPRKYHFYMSEDGTAYFVLRKSSLKGMNLLLLVDYRVPFKDEKAFDSIVRITKKIAKANRLDGVFVVSSHAFFDKLLKRNFFLDIRGKGLIMTNAEIGVPAERMRKRELIYATMADSDVELALFQ